MGAYGFLYFQHSVGIIIAQARGLGYLHLMKINGDFYKSTMREHLSRRIETNSRYSLRAYAKALSVDVSDLSKVFSDKKALSIPNAEKIAYKLGLDPDEKDLFMLSVFTDHQERGRKKRIPQAFLEKVDRKERLVDNDQFRMIADWYHAAIMELSYIVPLPARTSEAVAICIQKFGITQTQAKIAIERLLSLEMLKEQNGFYIKSDKNLTTNDRRMTTPARKKFLLQALEKAADALENTVIEERKMTTITLAIDANKIDEAKDLIDDFKIKMMKFLESGKPTKVYHLSVNLYPLENQSEENPGAV